MSSLTVLWEPAPSDHPGPATETAEPRSDIVFVHGLNSLNVKDHATRTWMHSNGTLWPKDLLPRYVPGSRILLYAYNSNVAFNSSSASINDHADSLLDRYDALRGSARNTPIIFVAHSLGGLVVKKALIRAHTDRHRYGYIQQLTYGLVFFGTPHRGGKGVGPGKIACNIVKSITGSSSNDILSHLEQDSIFSQDADDQFRSQLESYKIVSFFETRAKRVHRFALGTAMIVVPRESATLGLASQREVKLELDANHSDICKFSDDGQQFAPVWYHIQRLTKEAVELASTHGMDTRENFATDEDEVDNNIVPRDSENHPNQADKERYLTFEDLVKNERYSSCIASLDIANQAAFLWRKSDKKHTALHHFRDSDQYRHWDNGPAADILWVTAGPGCGKTTLLADLVESLRETRPGEHGMAQTTSDNDKDPYILSFFFDQSNTEAERTANCALRTLIHKLVAHNPSLFPALYAQYVLFSARSPISWSYDSLWAVFLSMLHDIQGAVKVYLILDGLDECEVESRRTWLKDIRQLVYGQRTELTQPFNAVLKVLISSRRNEDVSQTLKDPQTFEIRSEDTAEDMQQLIKSRVQEIADTRNLSSNIAEKVEHFLHSNAHGMFVWVLLILEDLSSRDFRLTDESVAAKLLSIPSTLFVIYEKIFTGGPPERQPDLWRMLRWCAFSKRPLTLDELSTALCLETNVRTWHDLAGDLKYLCGPLIRFEDGEIGFVHQSALDSVMAFALAAENVSLVNTGGIAFDDESAETALGQTCLQFLVTDPSFHELSVLGLDTICLRDVQDKMNAHGFLAYSTRYWAIHLQALPGTPSPDIFQWADNFLSDHHRRSLTMMTTYFFMTGGASVSNDSRLPGWPSDGSKLHLASYFRLPWLVATFLAQGSDPNAECSTGDSPLVWAAETGSKAVVSHLLAAGADPCQPEIDGWTAMHWAALKNHLGVFRLLLDARADPFAADARGNTPLDLAARRGNWAIVAEVNRSPMSGREQEPSPSRLDQLSHRFSGATLSSRDIDHEPKSGERLYDGPGLDIIGTFEYL